MLGEVKRRERDAVEGAAHASTKNIRAADRQPFFANQPITAAELKHRAVSLLY